LSARYFDIIKDRLYTFAPRNEQRRSAQTALYRIADSLARMLAPLLAFTADEIWENLPQPAEQANVASVHLAMFPEASGSADAVLVNDWKRLFEVRDQVLGALESARVAKAIGSSLEASIELKTGGETYRLLQAHASDLRYLFIVSQVTLLKVDGGDANVAVVVQRAPGQKCDRCWNYSTLVGQSTRYPTVCERCLAALEETEQTAK
jgi:isoleucyl-tRNA synthetase